MPKNKKESPDAKAMEDKEKQNIEDDITIESDEDNLKESSFGGDSKKLRDKLKTVVSEKQEYLAGWQRAKADLINSKRDFEEQKKDFIKFAKGDLIIQIIPVLNSFDMAFQNTNGVPEQWLKGVEYIYNQFVSVLEENGVKQINPKVGEEFDINKHNSVEIEKVENKNDSGKIFSVIQKGYELNGKVLREAKVRVGE